MDAKRSAQILFVLSISFGGTLGILGAVGSSAVSIVAIVGGLVIGGLWAVRAVLTRSG